MKLDVRFTPIFDPLILETYSEPNFVSFFVFVNILSVFVICFKQRSWVKAGTQRCAVWKSGIDLMQ